ncbi:MAG: flagellar hook protein FlgE [Armatimonadota bacterium]|nr:MAG: flagellar hook protein FlgE [Armatimonadota bacterium]
MLQAMFSSISSIKAHQVRMGVVGNNIANINTTGFKSGRVNFQEMLSQTLRGATRPVEGGMGGTNPMQIGLGTQVGSIDTILEQGSLQATNRVTDMAIQGNGFFVVSNNRRVAFTRDGNFDIDANGTLVHKATGEKLVGWMPKADGTIDVTEPLGPHSFITIPVGKTVAGQATTSALFKGNLELSGTSWTTSVMVYDAVGASHELRLRFSRPTADPPNTPWQLQYSLDGGTSWTLVGNVEFDTSGRIINGANQTITFTPPGTGAPDVSINLDLSRITQLATYSTVEPISQNGYPPGTLEQLTISPDGVINGVFSNGLNLPIARVALAVFNNPAGLERTGNNLFRESANSGVANIGTAQTGGRGTISAGYLEMSNADIGNEFTNLIITQRGFQANTRIVSTVDELLQDVLQMKR